MDVIKSILLFVGTKMRALIAVMAVVLVRTIFAFSADEVAESTVPACEKITVNDTANRSEQRDADCEISLWARLL